MNEIELVEGDTLPHLVGEVTNDDGTPVDITGWDISLHIGYTPPLVKPATIPIGTDGIYQFLWSEGDLVRGRWPAEVQIVSPEGIQTFRKAQSGDAVTLIIAPQIA